jgi:hypothetical protein
VFSPGLGIAVCVALTSRLKERRYPSEQSYSFATFQSRQGNKTALLINKVWRDKFEKSKNISKNRVKTGTFLFNFIQNSTSKISILNEILCSELLGASF